MPYRRTCDQCGYGYEYETRPLGGECYCSSKCQSKAEEESLLIKVDLKSVKSKARNMQKKIQALKLEALNVAVFLEDNGHGLASAHFTAIGDSLLKASDAAELLS